MIRTEVARELWELDQLNLEVAKFRAEHGISPSMIHLYGAMGRLCQKLISLDKQVGSIELLQQDVIDLFQVIGDKEDNDA